MAGTIEEVGAVVSAFEMGEQVYGMVGGLGASRYACSNHQSGTEFETNLAGQDVLASVQESYR